MPSNRIILIRHGECHGNCDMEQFATVPDYAIELRDQYSSIVGAWHWNKKYWNQIAITQTDVPDALIRDLIDHSYSEVVKKMPRKLRDQLPIDD